MKTGEPYNLELKLIRPDGTTRWVNAFGGATYDNHGRKEGLQGTVQDITDRKQAEEALRESEARYRQLVEYAPAAICEADLTTGRLLSVNEVLCEYSGYTRDELLALNPLDLMTEESQKLILQRMAGYAAGEPVPPDVEYKARSKSGREFWISTNAKYFYQAGLPVRATVVAYDITERKRAEEALRRAEENFRLSLDDSPLGVRIVTEEGETVYANRAILDIYGYDSIEELNTTPIKKRYTPESYAEFQIRREKRRQGVDAPSEYTINIIRKDGEVRQLQVFRKPTLWDGEKQFQVIYQDITEHKQAEEEKRRMEERSRKVVEDIFRFIPEGVLVFSRKMELLRQNQAFRELVSGYAKRIGFAEDELENLIVDKIKAAMGDENIKEIRISRKHETGEQT
jgi:PAS domain S-box-containing protein